MNFTSIFIILVATFGATVISSDLTSITSCLPLRQTLNCDAGSNRGVAWTLDSADNNYTVTKDGVLNVRHLAPSPTSPCGAKSAIVSATCSGTESMQSGIRWRLCVSDSCSEMRNCSIEYQSSIVSTEARALNGRTVFFVGLRCPSWYECRATLFQRGNDSRIIGRRRFTCEEQCQPCNDLWVLTEREVDFVAEYEVGLESDQDGFARSFFARNSKTSKLVSRPFRITPRLTFAFAEAADIHPEEDISDHPLLIAKRPLLSPESPPQRGEGKSTKSGINFSLLTFLYIVVAVTILLIVILALVQAFRKNRAWSWSPRGKVVQREQVGLRSKSDSSYAKTLSDQSGGEGFENSREANFLRGDSEEAEYDHESPMDVFESTPFIADAPKHESRIDVLSILLCPGVTITKSITGQDLKDSKLASLDKFEYVYINKDESSISLDRLCESGKVIRIKTNSGNSLYIKTCLMAHILEELHHVDRMIELLNDHDRDNHDVILELKEGKFPEQVVIDKICQSIHLDQSKKSHDISNSVLNYLKYMGFLYPIPLFCLNADVDDNQKWFQIPHVSTDKFSKEQWSCKTNEYQIGYIYNANQDIPPYLLSLISLSVNKYCQYPTRKDWNNGLTASSGNVAVYIQLENNIPGKKNGAYKLESYPNSLFIVCRGPLSQKQSVSLMLEAFNIIILGYCTLWPYIKFERHYACISQTESIKSHGIADQTDVREDCNICQPIVEIPKEIPKERFTHENPAPQLNTFPGCFTKPVSPQPSNNLSIDSSYSSMESGIVHHSNFEASPNQSTRDEYDPNMNMIQITDRQVYENHKQAVASIGVYLFGRFQHYGTCFLIKIFRGANRNINEQIHIMTCMHVIHAIAFKNKFKIPTTLAEINSFLSQFRICISFDDNLESQRTKVTHVVTKVVEGNFGSNNETDHIMLHAMKLSPIGHGLMVQPLEQLYDSGLINSNPSILRNILIVGYHEGRWKMYDPCSYKYSFTITCAAKVKRELNSMIMNTEVKQRVRENVEVLDENHERQCVGPSDHTIENCPYHGLEEDVRCYETLMKDLDKDSELAMLTDPRRILVKTQFRQGSSGSPIFTTGSERTLFPLRPRVPNFQPVFLMGMFLRGFPMAAQDNNELSFLMKQGVWIQSIA